MAAGRHRGHGPVELGRPSGRQRAERPGVRVRGDGAAGAAAPGGEPGWQPSCTRPAAGRRSRSGATGWRARLLEVVRRTRPRRCPRPRGAGYAQVTLQIVTATFGIVLVPVLRIASTRCVCSDRRWMAGKVAVVTATGKLPARLARVLPRSAAASGERRAPPALPQIAATAPRAHRGAEHSNCTARPRRLGRRFQFGVSGSPRRRLSRHRVAALEDLGGWSRFDQSRRRSWVLAHQGPARRGRQHDDPDRQDARLRRAPAVPVRAASSSASSCSRCGCAGSRC